MDLMKTVLQNVKRKMGHSKTFPFLVSSHASAMLTRGANASHACQCNNTACAGLESVLVEYTYTRLTYQCFSMSTMAIRNLKGPRYF